MDAKYTQFIQTTLVPLNGVPPVLYSFEITLLSTALNLKSNIIDLMKKHNVRIKCLLNGYLKEIEASCNQCIVPIEIIDLCGSFYDDFYPMTVNANINNFAVYSEAWDHSYRLIPDEKIHRDKKYIVYELTDETVLAQYFKLNKIHQYAILQIHLGKNDVKLSIKLPCNIIIRRNVLKELFNKKIILYLSTKDEQTFSIHIGNANVDNIDGIVIIKYKRYNSNHTIFAIKNIEDEGNVLMNMNDERFLRNKLDYSDSFKIQWNNLDAYVSFNANMFTKPVDTLSNHVNAIEFEVDQTDVINKIENMFD